jgi:hypothetical protein
MFSVQLLRYTKNKILKISYHNGMFRRLRMMSNQNKTNIMEYKCQI